MLLSDKVCIVTGAASPRGIGRATARLFAKHGARFVILDLDEGQARDAAADLGQGHLGLACNVTDSQACLNAAERVMGECGRIVHPGDVDLEAGVLCYRSGCISGRAWRFNSATNAAMFSTPRSRMIRPFSAVALAGSPQPPEAVKSRKSG